MGKQRKRKTQTPCTGRDKNKVPMKGYCRVENVVYKLAVSTTEKSKEHDYIDVADSDWKQSYYNQALSFRNQRHKKA